MATRFYLRYDGWLPMSSEEALHLAEDIESVVELGTEEIIEGKVSKLVEGPPFSIWRINESLHISRTGSDGFMVLDLEQAKSMIPYLERAPRLIAFVDSLIRF